MNPIFHWKKRATFESSFSAETKALSVAAYQELTAGMADQTPYRIGLSSEDLYRSFENENVCKLLLEENSRQLILPLFGPPSVDSNLNLGYFNRMQKDHDCEVVYFFYIPGLPLSPHDLPETMRQLLMGYAESKKAFCCDTQTGEIDSLMMLEAILRGAGIDSLKSRLLDAQCYFAGILSCFTSGFTESVHEFSEAIQVIHPTLLQAREMKVSVRQSMNESESEGWWSVYQQAFDEIEGNCFEIQRFDHEEFMETMVDPLVYKGVAYSNHNTPIAMVCFRFDDFSKKGINTAFFWNRFPEETRLKKIMYIDYLFSTGLLIRKPPPLKF